MKPLTIIIPNRIGEDPVVTVSSLYKQSFLDFDVRIVNDMDGNANKARNEGMRGISSKYVLFSDNDINWLPGSIASMYEALENNRKVSFAYGSYDLDGKVWCNRDFSIAELLIKNYISTMSMVRTADHPGFDESIRRLQDWDVWLSMVERGKKGLYINKMIFKTTKREGITYNSIPWCEAVKAINKKHNLYIDASCG